MIWFEARGRRRPSHEHPTPSLPAGPQVVILALGLIFCMALLPPSGAGSSPAPSLRPEVCGAGVGGGEPGGLSPCCLVFLFFPPCMVEPSLGALRGVSGFHRLAFSSHSSPSPRHPGSPWEPCVPETPAAGVGAARGPRTRF